ncbi:MAG TPA: hypothetical protein PKV52_04780, partial [Candidatus Saccharibacteria bacterium]|nr:hypothetical protein [Candidatus Saccharibacteria bacterium]
DNEFWVLAKIDQPGSDDENTSATKQIELMRYTDGRLDTPSSIREISIPNAMAMKKYKDGMIIYSKDDVDAYFLSSFEAQPQKINFAELDKIDGYGFDIEIYNNQISYYYKTHIRDTGNTAEINNLPITMVTDLKSPQLIDTPYIYSYAFACGDKNICIGLADENELVIVSGSSKKSVFNVRDYTIINNSLLLQIESTFVLYDVGDNSGTIVYQGNEYNTPCGIQSTFSGVRICVDAKKTGNLYSVQLNLNSPKSTNIIDVINQISENNYVDSVTVLGNIIYINDAVEPVYNEIIGEYLDDPEESAYAEQSIRQTVSETGVDTNKYSVVIL